MLFVRTSGYREKKQMRKQRDEDIRAKKEKRNERRNGKEKKKEREQ